MKSRYQLVKEASQKHGVNMATIRGRMRVNPELTADEAAQIKPQHGGWRGVKPKPSEKKNVGNAWQKDVNYEARNKLFNVDVANRYHGLRLV